MLRLGAIVVSVGETLVTPSRKSMISGYVTLEISIARLLDQVESTLFSFIAFSTVVMVL